MLTLDHLWKAFIRAIWEAELSSLPAWRASLIRLLRGIYTLARDLAEGRLTLYAASLVYTKAPQIIRAFDEGAVIRSKRGRFLAIPPENAPRQGPW